ncbi:CHY zinc finger protein [Natronorarus salvus]|uniref:CHY zinc finger protein n=1 Tax=Natronorarus salvus TaxID=3117733 RepID=UPI002F26783F
MNVHGHPVGGVDVGPETRCEHHHTARDVIAIRFRCCLTYYPCFACHETSADHEAERWSREQWDREAVLCGVCGTELTIREYLDSPARCPTCEATFNPGCVAHHDRYFEP